MSSYCLLRQGDRLPTVAVLQKLLNRANASAETASAETASRTVTMRAMSWPLPAASSATGQVSTTRPVERTTKSFERPLMTGSARALPHEPGPLVVDGVFGAKTAAAVREFQRSRGLHPTGEVAGDEWRRLMHHDVLPLVDCIDVFDEHLYEQQAQLVVASGGHPIMIGGMSNGLMQAAEALSSARLVFLLRFIGHGCPGVQGVSIGKGGWFEYVPGRKRPVAHFFGEQNSKFHVKNAPSAGRLRLQRIFGPYSSVELHGCHVAAGRLGHHFVSEMATALDVPVTAAIRSQRSALRFDGPTFTAFPRRLTLKDWGASLPDFTPVSVP